MKASLPNHITNSTAAVLLLLAARMCKVVRDEAGEQHSTCQMCLYVHAPKKEKIIKFHKTNLVYESKISSRVSSLI